MLQYSLAQLPWQWPFDGPARSQGGRQCAASLPPAPRRGLEVASLAGRDSGPLHTAFRFFTENYGIGTIFTKDPQRTSKQVRVSSFTYPTEQAAETTAPFDSSEGRPHQCSVVILTPRVPFQLRASLCPSGRDSYPHSRFVSLTVYLSLARSVSPSLSLPLLLQGLSLSFVRRGLLPLPALSLSLSLSLCLSVSLSLSLSLTLSLSLSLSLSLFFRRA